MVLENPLVPHGSAGGRTQMRDHSIRSIWSLDGSQITRPPLIVEDGSSFLPGSGGAFPTLRHEAVAALFSLPASPSRPTVMHTFLVCMRADRVGVASEGSERAPVVRCGGAPVPGGVCRVRHGDVLTIGQGDQRARYWLSSEGPARRLVNPAPARDALTLDPLPAGRQVVACRCGELYAPQSWREARRCVTCGLREDGIFRELPPGARTAPDPGR